MNHKILLLISMTILLGGCSRSISDNPIEPSDTGIPTPSVQSPDTTSQNRYLIGFWNVQITPDTGEVEIIPNRLAEMHINAVRLLEDEPCTNCLSIENITVHPGNVMSAQIWIKHPYAPTNDFCVFDPRGIFITGADYEFTTSGKKIAWGNFLPRMIDPDGYTNLFNPTDFPPTLPGPPALRYIPGEYANGGTLSATLNPFLAFAKDADRRIFGAGYPYTYRAVRIHTPIDGSVVQFGYALDGCWMPVENVTNPWVDYPPEANCTEAYEIRVQLDDAVLPFPGSQAPIVVDVLDHQGLETIAGVTIEGKDFFNGEISLSYSAENSDGSFRYTGMLPNQHGVDVGEYPLLIKVTDTQSDPNFGILDAYQVISVSVIQSWAQTWGATSVDSGNAVALDKEDNVYVAGQFMGTVDFDPGPEEAMHTASHGAYVSKYKSTGEFCWVNVWGIESGTSAAAYSVALDDAGYIYVTGNFSGGIDFDPGQGFDFYSGSDTVFVLQFNPEGFYEWVRAWGSGSYSAGFGVDTSDDGYIYITGVYSGIVDFDPTIGIDLHTSNGGGDAFLSKLDNKGSFEWAKTWGGTGQGDRGEAVSVDQHGNVYISGAYEDQVNFNPDSPPDYHTSYGDLDCFLVRYDSSGEFSWAQTWGGFENDMAHTVAAPCTGLVVVAGEFRNLVDFDPGPGYDPLDPPGNLCSFISVFTAEGEYLSCEAWGPTPEPPPNSYEPVTSMGVDATGNLYVTGFFAGEVNFNPEGLPDVHTSNGGWDCFISKFDSGGSHLWTRTWGGSENDRGLGVAVSKTSGIFATGFFGGDADFNPGDEEEWHMSNGSIDAFLVKYTPNGDW